MLLIFYFKFSDCGVISILFEVLVIMILIQEITAEKKISSALYSITFKKNSKSYIFSEIFLFNYIYINSFECFL